ncbi:MAG: 1,4-dihydroxy-6-naphthoate synthase, partial [Deltaproteobacteria bacterium]|nr:1,4-dihydroxy-6-naphthoate synthase [Deltaproteobacteria bacterium]
PCPNDTFLFYAMIHGKVDTKNLSFKELLLDVETLNQKALQAEMDLTKISFHAFGHIQNNYCLLRAGGALGRGCGPLVIARHACSMEELRGKKIAIPGRLTTAHLLLQLFDSSFIPRRRKSVPQHSDVLVMPFHEIIKAVMSGNADAGLIIHESRFTYSFHGLHQVMDLGEWWEKDTGLPIPLGGIVAKRSLGEKLITTINTVLRTSVEYALNNRQEPLSYIQEHSQELS